MSGMRAVGAWIIRHNSRPTASIAMGSAKALPPAERRALVLMAPGWVRTELGGPDARLSIDESIPNLVTTLDALHGSPGLHYVDYLGRTVAW